MTWCFLEQIHTKGIENEIHSIDYTHTPYLQNKNIREQNNHILKIEKRKDHFSKLSSFTTFINTLVLFLRPFFSYVCDFKNKVVTIFTHLFLFI